MDEEVEIEMEEVDLEKVEFDVMEDDFPDDPFAQPISSDLLLAATDQKL